MVRACPLRVERAEGRGVFVWVGDDGSFARSNRLAAAPSIVRLGTTEGENCPTSENPRGAQRSSRNAVQMDAMFVRKIDLIARARVGLRAK